MEAKHMKSYTIRLGADLKRYKYLYMMAVPVIMWYAVFCYAPLYGVQIAFRNFAPGRGITGSPFVGIKYFIDFFNGRYFSRTVRNTLFLSIYSTLFIFPLPIIFALMLNEVRHSLLRRVVQTVSYLPHFISLVVVCSLIREFTSSSGLINNIGAFFGASRRSLLLLPRMFRTIYISSEIWQELGWNSIIYIAAITAIDQTQYDAAAIDGANRWQRIQHVTVPGIMPTVAILFILRLGMMMSVGYEKILLLYNEAIYETSDTVSTYLYRKGLQEYNYGYSAAVGLFNSVINFALVITANKLSRKLSGEGLW
ncbi:sugar ABC transporter permease [Clostridia bacterium]|nr:sugar ABC transporter permease [Clostridia bacterium]